MSFSLFLFIKNYIYRYSKISSSSILPDFACSTSNLQSYLQDKHDSFESGNRKLHFLCTEFPMVPEQFVFIISNGLYKFLTVISNWHGICVAYLKRLLQVETISLWVNDSSVRNVRIYSRRFHQFRFKLYPYQIQNAS